MNDILAYGESFKHWSASIDYACRLAALTDAQLTGICVCPAPTAMLAPYETPELIMELLEVAEQLKVEAYQAAPAFEAFARERGTTHASWQVAQDEVPRALALAGDWHDLLILGRTGHSPWGSVSAVGNLVLGSGMPCIVTPKEPVTTVDAQRFAIAWNGSREAIRAVHAALSLLKRARQVTILHGTQRPPTGLDTWKPPFDLSSYLSQHGIANETLLLPDTGSAAGPMLLDAARDARADMLVMGAYGHTRFSEWVLGGATRGVLEAATLPLFMRH